MLEYLKNNWSIFIAVIGWIVTLITDHQKIKQHETDIKNLWSNNKQIDVQLSQINLNLSELNVKVGMLLQNKELK